jgi:hypothetical protein
MSVLRLTDVQDNTHSSKQYWDKRYVDKSNSLGCH